MKLAWGEGCSSFNPEKITACPCKAMRIPCSSRGLLLPRGPHTDFCICLCAYGYENAYGGVVFISVFFVFQLFLLVETLLTIRPSQPALCLHTIHTPKLAVIAHWQAHPTTRSSPHRGQESPRCMVADVSGICLWHAWVTCPSTALSVGNALIYKGPSKFPRERNFSFSKLEKKAQIN